jgi:hypothetical protein
MKQSLIRAIAQAFNRSPHSVIKWPEAKLEKAVRLLSIGVDPIIMQLTGELHAACYAANCSGIGRWSVNTYTDNECSHFSFYRIDTGDYETFSATVENLQRAIDKLNGVIYAQE